MHFAILLPTVETVGYFRSSIRDLELALGRDFDMVVGETTATKRTLMHSFTSCLMHCVWSTKERRPYIKSDLQQRLWPYLGGIARENNMRALIVGGVEDHVHVLLSVPATLSVAKSIQLLKGNASKWVHETFRDHWDFEWQEGYGAFSVGISGVEDTTHYIQHQSEHHRKTTFKEELETFLKKHGMQYVERDLE